MASSNAARTVTELESQPEARTFVYKYADGIPLSMDVYLPRHNHVPSESVSGQSHHSVPAVLYFHGGGLAVGNRKSWFPSWLHRRITAAGCFFISVDYRLIPPSTGHHVLTDIKDAVHFISQFSTPLVSEIGQDLSAQSNIILQVDQDAIAVAGTSAGGLCAYLAAMHATPKPKAVLSMYGTGGNLMTPHYYSPKTEVFFRGRELLNASQFSEYLFPSSRLLPPTSDSPLSYHPKISSAPGYPANPRMLLARLFLQLGVYLDYYTGCHEPSLSAALRESAARDAETTTHSEADTPQFTESAVNMKALISKHDLRLFPQFGVSSAWPPTFLIHGSMDTAVPADESRHLYMLLRRADVETALMVIEGKEHSFDYEQGADETYGGEGGLFDQAAGFLIRHLRPNSQQSQLFRV